MCTSNVQRVIMLTRSRAPKWVQGTCSPLYHSVTEGFWSPPLLQPCGGAIPLCMVDEFDLPAEIIDRKVTKMKMISPSNREVDVGKTLSETEYIGMCRREVRSSSKAPKPCGAHQNVARFSHNCTRAL